ncbi:MAG: hypothetical protein Q8P46_02055 [Hyphomicrobiales bacterium]|nr:hypothetical protein [Hyphomicrobiales bacterium]
MRKTIITLATAAALSVAAIAPTATPASASHVGFSLGIHGDGFSVGIGTPGYFGDPFFGPALHKHCTKKWKKIWTPAGPVWKKVKNCWLHEHH